MENLKHNEEEVLRQVVPWYDFMENLNNHGIKPVELPIEVPGYVIIRYELDNIVKYVAVGKQRDEVFLTTKVPEDGWENLIKDCHNQLNGEKPEKTKSRFSIALAKAEERAYNRVEEKVPNAKPDIWIMDISGYTKEAQDEFIRQVHFAMEGIYGYNKDYVEQIQLTPEEKKVIAKILNNEYYWQSRITE